VNAVFEAAGQTGREGERQASKRYDPRCTTVLDQIDTLLPQQK